MAQATNTTEGEIVLAGDLTGDANAPALRASGVVPGSYQFIHRVSADSKGRLTSIGATTVEQLIALIPDATTTSRGVVSIGQNFAVSSGLISLPTATTSVRGLFSIDGSTLTVSGSEVSAGGLYFQDASTTVKGRVQVDPVGLVVQNGLLWRFIDATYTNKGIVQIGNGFILITGRLNIQENYLIATSSSLGLAAFGPSFNITDGVVSIPFATNAEHGITKAGSHLSITGGNLVADVITPTTPGIFKIGTNLSMDGDTFNGLPPDATMNSKGIVSVGSGLVVTNGIVSVDDHPIASTSAIGVVQIAAGDPYLTISGGVVSMSVPDATAVTKGLVSIAANSGLDSIGGSLSIQLATPSLKGIVRPGNNFSLSGTSINATVPDASPSVIGVVQLTAGQISVDANAIIGLVPATNSTLGAVQPASVDFSISNGQLSIANGAALNRANVYTAAQVTQSSVAAYSATFVPNFSVNTCEITLAGNILIQAPTGVVAGGVYLLLIRTDTGARSITFSSEYKFNKTLAWSSTPNAIDVLQFICVTPTILLCSQAPGF